MFPQVSLLLVKNVNFISFNYDLDSYSLGVRSRGRAILHEGVACRGLALRGHAHSKAPGLQDPQELAQAFGMQSFHFCHCNLNIKAVENIEFEM